MRIQLAGVLLAATALSAIPAHAETINDVMGPIDATPKDAAEINARCDKFIGEIQRRAKQLEDETGPATIDGTLRRYDDLNGLFLGGFGEFGLDQEVMEDDARRDAGGACQVRLSAEASKIGLSRPIYDRLVAIDASKADAMTKYYLKLTLESYVRGGVSLPADQRAEVQALQEKIAKIGNDFDANIAAGEKSIEVDPSELAGLPGDFVAAHKPGEDGKVTINTTYPDYQPVMAYADSDKLRHDLSAAYNQRAWPKNDEELQQLFHLRQQLAEKLGFRNYAELILQDKMVNTPEKVQTLLDEMAAAAKPAAERDYAKLLAMLKEKEPGATKVEYWQQSWLKAMVQKRDYDYDPQEARKYFAYNDVRDGILQLASDMFGIEFKKWDTPLWDPDVEAYEVFQSGKLIGRIYIDSHPRPGKYTHANAVPLRGGIPGKAVPMAALVMNLPKGDHTTGLMEHRDVETFLHEFGHLLHHIFGGTQHWQGEAMSNVQWDFVEAPSQMLENWVYDYDTLAKFAKDKDGKVIPRELVAKMNKARYFNLGLEDMTQLGYANISLKFHTEPVPEYMGEATRYFRDKYATIPSPGYLEMQDSFGHLNGYSAMYYTYRWSKVIADDLFTRFEKEGLRNPKTAMEYRKDVLEPGATVPAGDLLKAFLGRDVTLDAYKATMEKDR